MKSHQRSFSSPMWDGNEFKLTDDEPPSAPEIHQKLTIQETDLTCPGRDRTDRFRRLFYPFVSDHDWNSWIWQLANSLGSWDQLGKFINLSQEELLSSEKKKKLPIRITPYYASLIDQDDPHQPIRRTMVPVYQELLVAPEERADPLEEENQSPVPQIVHRYPDRVLFLTTGVCAAYCRYCTRSHAVSSKDKIHARISQWDTALNYIRLHPEIRDVLLSGGDPLTLTDDRLEYLLSQLRAIPHVEIIRIGTKVPVVLPQRITPSLLGIMKKHHPLFMSIHVTHPAEITPEVEFACSALADAGIPLGSQTVLLKGINDQVEIMKNLYHLLLKLRIRPYYLYQCDPIPGSVHFRTPVEKGLEIIRGLRGHTSGYAIPHFVIDSPGGGGKIPILPNYIAERNEAGYILENYLGNKYLYMESKHVNDDGWTNL